VWLVGSANENDVLGHVVLGNYLGVVIDQSSGNKISGDLVLDNTRAGLLLYFAHGNTLWNNLFSNARDYEGMGDTSHNTWEAELLAGATITGTRHEPGDLIGSWWSGYRGVDAQPVDGKGDTPYPLDGHNADPSPIWDEAPQLWVEHYADGSDVPTEVRIALEAWGAHAVHGDQPRRP